ncbi:MAG: MSMEG_0570 family nitrogen starvation response protein [Chthoniobacteraceae bacterium]
MPEVLFTIQLPDGVEKQCYSPSTVVRDYFSAGEELSVADFLTRSRAALAEASERVRAKYGFSCSSAMSQLAEIEQTTRDYPPAGIVRIVSI